MGIAYSGFCRHCVLFLGYSMWSDLSGLTSRIFSFSDDHLFPKQTRDHQRMYGIYVWAESGAEIIVKTDKC